MEREKLFFLRILLLRGSGAGIWPVKILVSPISVPGFNKYSDTLLRFSLMWSLADGNDHARKWAGRHRHESPALSSWFSSGLDLDIGTTWVLSQQMGALSLYLYSCLYNKIQKNSFLHNQLSCNGLIFTLPF